MSDEQQLRSILNRIDGKGYKAYKDLRGSYRFERFTLLVDYVQGDPFAAPSRLRARVPMEVAAFPRHLYSDRPGRVALEDFLTRCFARALQGKGQGGRGTGKSGLIFIDCGGQEILQRSSMVVADDFVEARFSVGLPARGRTVLGRQAQEMLCQEVPRLVEASLYWENVNKQKAEEHVYSNRLQEHLRGQLEKEKLVAFAAEGSLLPRRSGISDKPMDKREAVILQAPPELSVCLQDLQGEKIKGMGIPEGVTLIVGGGYHGKSTLLRGMERGIYNHVPGDGRERLVTRESAVKIRAEDGRRVARVDISPFISNLPGGRSTVDFFSEEASGSTSQAANIMELLEVGTGALLMDEDTSATNFMIRDARMQALVAKEKEPITPFIDRVRALYRERGVSTLLVIGGSGDYFDVADSIILMEEYVPRVVTREAREISDRFPTGRKPEGGGYFGPVKARVPDPGSLNPQKGRKVKIAARGVDEIQFGRENMELSCVEQIVDPSQARAIGDFIHFLLRRHYLDGRNTLSQAIALGFREVEKQGLDVISPFFGQHPGDYALPRPQEVAAAVNRLRTLVVKQTR